MRLGIVSDIHCHADELAGVLASLDGEIDQLWCAGDIVLEYRFCGRTTALLRDAGAAAIKGNHDAMLLSPAGAGARARLTGQDDELSWLAALPARREETFDGRRVLMVHGSPWEPYGDYLTPRDRRWQRADGLGVDVVITGHTHEPMAERFGSTLVVNPGSIGEPRQLGERIGTYAVLDTATLRAEIRRVDC